MTIGRWYEVTWQTDDHDLDVAMRLYVERHGLKLSLGMALEIVDVADSLFALPVEILSVSEVGSFPIERRRRKKLSHGRQVRPTWRGHPVYAPVLEKYGVTNLRYAEFFTGRRCMLTATDGTFIYDILNDDAFVAEQEKRAI